MIRRPTIALPLLAVLVLMVTSDSRSALAQAVSSGAVDAPLEGHPSPGFEWAMRA